MPKRVWSSMTQLWMLVVELPHYLQPCPANLLSMKGIVCKSTNSQPKSCIVRDNSGIKFTRLILVKMHPRMCANCHSVCHGRSRSLLGIRELHCHTWGGWILTGFATCHSWRWFWHEQHNVTLTSNLWASFTRYKNLKCRPFVQHVREDWDAQERELNRRVAERMRDLEPTAQGKPNF